MFFKHQTMHIRSNTDMFNVWQINEKSLKINSLILADEFSQDLAVNQQVVSIDKLTISIQNIFTE